VGGFLTRLWWGTHGGGEYKILWRSFEREGKLSPVGKTEQYLYEVDKRQFGGTRELPRGGAKRRVQIL